MWAGKGSGPWAGGPRVKGFVQTKGPFQALSLSQRGSCVHLEAKSYVSWSVSCPCQGLPAALGGLGQHEKGWVRTEKDCLALWSHPSLPLPRLGNPRPASEPGHLQPGCHTASAGTLWGSLAPVPVTPLPKGRHWQRRTWEQVDFCRVCWLRNGVGLMKWPNYSFRGIAKI